MQTKVLMSVKIRVVYNAGHGFQPALQNSGVRVTKSYPNHSSLRFKT